MIRPAMSLPLALVLLAGVACSKKSETRNESGKHEQEAEQHGSAHLPLKDIRRLRFLVVPEPKAEGAWYPVDGGMIAGMKSICAVNDCSFMAFSGINAIQKAIEQSLQASELLLAGEMDKALARIHAQPPRPKPPRPARPPADEPGDDT